MRIYQKLDGKISKLTKENKPDYENMSVQVRVSDGVIMVLLLIITKLGAEAKKQTSRTLEE